MMNGHFDGVEPVFPDRLKDGRLMNTPGLSAFAHFIPTDYCTEEDGVVEIPLLLPSWQVEALETVAHNQGQTAGEMIRHLLQEFLARKSRR
jgi:hypothetical protein